MAPQGQCSSLSHHQHQTKPRCFPPPPPRGTRSRESATQGGRRPLRRAASSRRRSPLPCAKHRSQGSPSHKVPERAENSTYIIRQCTAVRDKQRVGCDCQRCFHTCPVGLNSELSIPPPSSDETVLTPVGTSPFLMGMVICWTLATHISTDEYIDATYARPNQPSS